MKPQDLNASLRDLSQIRSMMEEHARFMSLSGLSGISAGATALASAALAFGYMQANGLHGQMYAAGGAEMPAASKHAPFLLLLGLCTLGVALALSTLFSVRMARKRQQPFWNAAAKRLLINMVVPLAAGGAYCLILLWHGQLWQISGATLLFYGMALFNAGKYTVREIRMLGICEIALGLAACLWPGFGLFFWALGFGVLHIAYGIFMFYRYERA